MRKRRTVETLPGVPRVHSGLELRQLRAFVSFVEHGQITAAARALGLAQSTVSESLLGLERALGAQVVVRQGNKTHGVPLTATGRALLPHAREVLAAVDRATAAVAEATPTARTTILVVANESLSTYVLPAAVARLRGRRVNVRVSISVAACAGVREGVTDGAFDLGLLLARATQPAPASARRSRRGVTRQVLAPQVPLMAFARTSHPLVQRSRRPITVDHLEPYTLLVSDASGDFHGIVTEYARGRQAGMPHIESTGSAEGIKRVLSERPSAIGFLPSYAVADELRSGTLAAIDLRPAPPTLQIEAWLSAGGEPHPAIHDFLDALVESCRSAVPDLRGLPRAKP